MIETQQSISRWADTTFGLPHSNLRIATRANEEMAELLAKLAVNDTTPEAVEEVADIVIVLYRLVENHSRSLHDAIDAKMAINRGRNWALDGTGHGYHL
jgi:NTP pyrophosphatase (non-canonical NTP hydrolase)